MEVATTKTQTKLDQLESNAALKQKAEKALCIGKTIEQQKLESGLYEYVNIDSRTKVLRKKQIL